MTYEATISKLIRIAEGRVGGGNGFEVITSKNFSKMITLKL